MTDKRKQEKMAYQNFNDIRQRILKGEKTTFAERNYYNMVCKKRKKKAKINI